MNPYRRGPKSTDHSHAPRRSCEICNGKGTIIRIKPGTERETETVPCPHNCRPSR